mmetsp:Transcript_3176/g.6425  ORF Transcript_3176/g.6425 Transcript_3176/m.6425 type:complete len:395 (+) Transcript_3176:42-1226(+)
MDTLLALDESAKQIPNMELCQQAHRYEYAVQNGNSGDAEELKQSIVEVMVADAMAPHYGALCAKYGWEIDQAKDAAMKETISEELEKIGKSYADALENAGDMELLDANFAKARLYARIGDIEKAYEAYDVILAQKKVSSGKKIDATLEKTRVAFFAMDKTRIKTLLEDAKKLIDIGGDWDRRNRWKVYEAYYLMSTREIRKAAEILLECIATFSCVELCSYNEFMSLAVITNIISLSRAQLKSKLVKNPQVISLMRESPHLERLVTSIYNCEYADFFRSIVEMHPVISNDRYLGPHVSYLIREYRVTAYSQFLDAYRSVMLSSMAASFGITVSLLDGELSRFIASGRLNAKIDKVGDIIETSRPDRKNGQYHEVIKKGDVLLNQIQKLARVVQM